MDTVDEYPRVLAVYTIEAENETKANTAFLRKFLPLINLDGASFIEIANFFKAFSYEIVRFDKSNIFSLE